MPQRIRLKRENTMSENCNEPVGERLAFENWAEAEGFMNAEEANAWRDENGYEDHTVDCMWIGWQARSQVPQGEHL
jgi:hypothetical protein